MNLVNRMININKKDNYFNIIANKSYKLNQPLFATLHNHKCSNNCNYCYVRYLAKDKKNQDINENLFDDDIKFKKVLKELKNEGILNLSFSGGEPLLIKNFNKKFIIARKMGFAVEIITSGCCWNDSLINFIALNEANVVLSFSASKASLHDEIVGRKNNFKKLYNLFFKLIAKSIPISINFLITKYNYSEIGNFYNLFRKYNVKINFSYDISPFIGQPNNIQNLYLNKQQFFEVVKQLDKIHKINYNSQSLSKMCNIGRLSVAIDETGIVWPCVMLRIKAGNLLENNFSQIWETADILLAIRNMSIRDFKSNGECTNLCIANNYIYSNDLYKNYKYPEILREWLKDYHNLYIDN